MIHLQEHSLMEQHSTHHVRAASPSSSRSEREKSSAVGMKDSPNCRSERKPSWSARQTTLTAPEVGRALKRLEHCYKFETSFQVTPESSLATPPSHSMSSSWDWNKSLQDLPRKATKFSFQFNCIFLLPIQSSSLVSLIEKLFLFLAIHHDDPSSFFWYNKLTI